MAKSSENVGCQMLGEFVDDASRARPVPKLSVQPEATGSAAALETALNAETDYSQEFSAKVRSLARAASDLFSADVEHDEDMNYGSAQKLVLWLDRAFTPVPPKDGRATYRLIDYVSSKGPFFALVALKLSAPKQGSRKKKDDEPEQAWAVIDEDQLPDELRVLCKSIRDVMTSRHYRLLPESVLSRQVQGRVTELDAKPATTFEVLFTELI